MPLVKASGALTVYKMIKNKNEASKQKFFSLLSPAMQEWIEKISLTSWITYQQEGAVFEAGAKVLFPGQAMSLRKLGNIVARDQFSGIYRIFMRIPTVEYIMQRVSQTWKTIHTDGDARVEKYTGKSAYFVVSGLAELPLTQREYLCGFIEGIVELTGKKNIRVDREDDSSPNWRWHVEFD